MGDSDLSQQLALSLTPEQVEMFLTLITERQAKWRKQIEAADARGHQLLSSMLKGALGELVVLSQILDIDTKGKA